jgi:hypothetical protein
MVISFVVVMKSEPERLGRAEDAASVVRLRRAV